MPSPMSSDNVNLAPSDLTPTRGKVVRPAMASPVQQHTSSGGWAAEQKNSREDHLNHIVEQRRSSQHHRGPQEQQGPTETRRLGAAESVLAKGRPVVSSVTEAARADSNPALPGPHNRPRSQRAQRALARIWEHKTCLRRGRRYRLVTEAAPGQLFKSSTAPGRELILNPGRQREGASQATGDRRRTGILQSPHNPPSARRSTWPNERELTLNPGRQREGASQARGDRQRTSILTAAKTLPRLRGQRVIKKLKQYRKQAPLCSGHTGSLFFGFRGTLVERQQTLGARTI
ncbi:hypothetical protein NDU88_002256 [Pleurodeles waltl]|uniref:Uncharacterized protein n=1 Tax=Pleurodeles waltl TaxID=8319 RepID=A0AAV7Q631_PLEWA|nr:hypothetical protein NDU88_002256 [Pleurodeles waltl]